jgi:two-component system, cell cycle response regulator
VPSILIVDEDSPQRTQLIELLAQAGHQVTVARDGEDGLSKWRKDRHELAVLDVSSAKMGGAELAARMKSETNHVFAPVMLIVSRPDLEARIEALSVADDVVSRPYFPGEVHARCEALLRTRQLVDQLRASRAESEARSTADRTTGLRNRVFLGERLNEEYKRAVRYNEPLSLILLSIDNLGDISATRGEAVADRVLHAVADMAKDSLRQIDVLTRYGRAELAALLPNTHFAGSLVCAERLHAGAPRAAVDEVIPLISMGVSFFPGRDVNEPADLLRVAARALDRAHEEGPGRICLFQHQSYLFQPKAK